VSGDERNPDVPEQEMGSVDEALAGFEGVEGAENSSVQSAEQDPVSSLTAQLKEEQNRSLRIQADMENLRKRMRREMEEDRKFAALPLLRDLLPVIDNLNRAIGSVSPDESSTGLLEGVKMVEQQLRGVLQNHNCQVIDAEGQAFNPNWHEAILEQPSAEHPKGTVLQVTQTGYRLHDRVIRPSQVIVSKEPT
jgi:molecular chaperone GrpE